MKLTEAEGKTFLKKTGIKTPEFFVLSKDQYITFTVTENGNELMSASLKGLYGLEEQLVVGIETDMGVDEFTNLKGMLYRIDPKFIEYSKTTIIIQ